MKKDNATESGAQAPEAAPREDQPVREADRRRERLAAALRENLKRRKEQARTRRSSDPD